MQEVKLQKFLFDHLQADQPALLACSGGPDSLFLFYQLLQVQKKRFFPLLVAHVDHAWRKESAQDAKHLQKIVESFGAQFFCKRLDISLVEGNLEDYSRKKRLEFFDFLYDKHACQCLLLGHQRNDQEELLFKRLMEGSHIWNLRGMRLGTEFSRMKVLRPLLPYEKKEIVNWMQKHKKVFVEDPSNRDTRFLRAKFRESLFPYLEKSFGKSGVQNLNALALEAQDLYQYLKEKTAAFYKQIEKSFFGWFLPPLKGSASLEKKFFFHELLLKEGISLSRQELSLLVQFIQERRANKRITRGEKTIFCDRGQLFFLCQSLQCWGEKASISLGETKKFSSWELSFSQKEAKPPSWKDLQQGRVLLPVQGKTLQLFPPEAKTPWPSHKTLGHLWNKEKVPSFFRTLLPLVRQENGKFLECLSGRGELLPKGETLSLEFVYRGP